MSDSVKDSFEKISLKRIFAQKFHRQTGRADERPENPRKLAAEKQVAREPGEQNSAGDGVAPAEPAQQLD